ncbi:Tat pathway signal sequence domain protein [Opitutaceae bacterium EW11]|nr:Tat pathway signal sequence domain protein [Opitutaceae bacterium EW11]
MNAPLSRRDFVKNSALAAAAALPLAQALVGSRAAAAQPAAPSTEPLLDGPGAPLRWLEGTPPTEPLGVTWGVPWKRGEHARGTAFELRDENGASVPVQSWPLAYWPDGSLKWTGHSAVLGKDAGRAFRVAAGSAAVAGAVKCQESPEEIVVDTGALVCRIPRRGSILVKSLVRDGREVARDGRLIGQRKEQAEPDATATVVQRGFGGVTESAVVEQSGPLRAVVKIDGRHREEDGRSWLPFSVRLYFHLGMEGVRMMHTFIFDGDEQKDFISGLGVRFTVPMRDSFQDRHVRFVGEGHGLWAEAVKPLTGLRRDSGKEARAAQIAGTPTPPENALPPAVSSRLQWIPTWGDFSLSQLSADGFRIQKRTKAGHGWIAAGAGRRAGGLGYVGGVSGGLVFAQRDFWQRHPTQLDIRGAATDAAEATVWLWSPEAAPMDLRFYHDGLGEDTYAKQTAAMDITYEDYEPGFGTPVGIARTNELMFWAVPATPSRERLVELADLVRVPPQLMARPEHILGAGVLGGFWKLPDPAFTEIEKRNDFFLSYYESQREQHRWYGFWDYGDIRHTYDADRHVWRYDIGGFAWDNSELSPDLWLWLTFLRTGRADVFRFAEAMTRHTGEVDVYHLGRFKGLGSRHNVQHWGCSAKQVRVSNAGYRRHYYFLTADERVGDLLQELAESHRAYLTLLPTRKVPGPKVNPPGPEGKSVYVSVGTDYGAIAAAWLAAWERTGDAKYRDRLAASMKGIGTLPKGFFSGGGVMDIETGAISAGPAQPDRDVLGVSHLNSVFGLVEICAELIPLVDAPEFDRAWLEYCELYSAPKEEQVKRLGKPLGGNGLTQAHSRLTAYAAFRKRDAALARRAWHEFTTNRGELSPAAPLTLAHFEGPDVLAPIDEAAWISTNSTAQWGLAAIEVVSWAGDLAKP